jgi:hypothetical protein
MDAFDEDYKTEQILNKFWEQVRIIEKLLNGYLSWLQRAGK